MKQKVISSLFLWISANIISNAWALDPLEIPEMVVIPAGSFMMGSQGYANEKPIHLVHIKKFEIGRYEITQGQWKIIMGNNPSHFYQCGDNCPVENISWDDIQVYLQKLNQQTGSNYRLPSEAEWEYACKAGAQEMYCESDSYVGDGAWYFSNSDKKTHSVGERKPNEFGLYDMSGNVWEWVQDWYHDNYNDAPVDGSAWVAGGAQASRVLRGGAWNSKPVNVRAANREYILPESRDPSYGFRVARSIL